jgi:Xaa-Pro aminopeptidase
MQTDITNLLTEHKLAALLVMGGTTANPPMYYFANGAHLGERTFLVQVQGKDPLLVCVEMERANAASTGLRFALYNQLGYLELLRAAQGNATVAFCQLVGRVLQAEGLSNGRVGWYGNIPVQTALQRLHVWQSELPQYTVGRDRKPTVLECAMQTKSAAEVTRLRALANRALQVISQVYDFLATQTAQNNVLCTNTGAPLTIGDIHTKIERWSAELGLTNPHGFIFAIGADAGLPHARGNPQDLLELGKTIVFDYFPQEIGGGYFYDFTRTWCLGYAPPAIDTAYQQVYQAQQLAIATLAAGQSTHVAQLAVLDYFEKHGHPTLRSHPNTDCGYVHSLGHGIGLDLHEFPTLSEQLPATTLQPGTVLTVEPGLYYPALGWGIRIEDYLWLDPTTLQWQTLGDFSKDLVIPLAASHDNPDSRH